MSKAMSNVTGPGFRVKALNTNYLLVDVKNQPIGSSCVTHVLAFCSYFKGREQTFFNPTSWHLVTYNFL